MEPLIIIILPNHNYLCNYSNKYQTLYLNVSYVIRNIYLRVTSQNIIKNIKIA